MLVRTSSINFSDVAVVERGYKALVCDKKTEKEIYNLNHNSRIFETHKHFDDQGKKDRQT